MATGIKTEKITAPSSGKTINAAVDGDAIVPLDKVKLIETVQSLEDYRATADALTELWEHKSNVCEQLALSILVEQLGDPQLQATAFNILYSVHKNQALSFAQTHLAQVPPYLRFAPNLQGLANLQGFYRKFA